MEKSKREVRVHGVSAYRDHKCRCQICRDAVAAKKRRQRIEKLITVQPMIDKFGDTFLKQFDGSIPKWLEEGISVFTVDRLCCARGLHPIEVYGDIWIDHALQKEKKECESGNQSRPVSHTRARTVRR